MELTDYDAVAAATEAITSLDVLVHNAGVSSNLEPIADTPVEEWQHLLEVNLVAAAELTRLLLRVADSAGGTSSSSTPGPGCAPTRAGRRMRPAKFGLRALADALRLEEPDLRVTSIFPGRIDTDMQRDIVAIEGDDYEPTRFLDPTTVASAVVAAIHTPADAHPAEIVLRPTGRRS